MTNQEGSTRLKKIWLVSSLASLILLGVWLYCRWRKRNQVSALPKRVESIDFGTATHGVTGLSDKEAMARQPDFDLEAEIKAEQRRFRAKAIRQSLFTTFNVDLFGMAIIQVLLGSPDGAFGTMLIVFINLVVNVFQQMYTKVRLDRILKDLRPQATVIREGRLHSIDPALIVVGDYLVVNTGDQILVDGELAGSGEITIEPTNASHVDRRKRLTSGDRVIAGSYCVEGRSVYIASQDGIEHYRAAAGRELQLLMGKKRTPLQSFMEMVFRVLFGLVFAFGLLLVIDALIQNAELVSAEYRDAFSIIFGIAPTSLFFILIITYVMGTFRISEHGALVYNSQSIEEIADIATLCISKESVVSGLEVKLERLEPPDGYEGLSENLIQRILGTIVHSVPLSNRIGFMLADALPGEERALVEYAPFLFTHGWYGITFDEPDLRGTFVIGLPEVLDNYLVEEKIDLLESVEETLNETGRGLKLWLGRFQRREKTVPLDENLSIVEGAADMSTELKASEDGDNKKNWRESLRARLERLLTPMEEMEMLVAEPAEPPEGVQLTMAYLPTPVDLFDISDAPTLPNGLIPLSRVHIREALRPEVGPTIAALVQEGMKVKLFSADAPERAASTMQKLGLTTADLPMIAGGELAEPGSQVFRAQAAENVIFGELSPGQKAAIVETLREQGERVIMVGSQVSDVPAMRQADLRVSLKSSAQAALQLTDIVLLEDSLAALPYVVSTGQRLVNGVLATFKLYLSQVISQLLLIIAMVIFKLQEFPYHPTQAGVISAFTIAVPNALLSVWASAGRVTEAEFRRQLARFIIPTAITTSLLAWGVYQLFLDRNSDTVYARLAVTYALLMAGWLRVLFVQPPSPFWVGAVPLRGDRRVIGLVIGSIMLTFTVIAIPLFQELLRVNWLNSFADYGLVILAVGIWALTLRTIWRVGSIEPALGKIAPRDSK